MVRILLYKVTKDKKGVKKMKKIIIILSLLMLISLVWSQNSSSATYSGGNVTLRYVGEDPQPPANSNPVIPLTVSLPSGARITSLDVEYDIRSEGAFWCNEIRSYLKCTST